MLSLEDGTLENTGGVNSSIVLRALAVTKGLMVDECGRWQWKEMGDRWTDECIAPWSHAI